MSAENHDSVRMPAALCWHCDRLLTGADTMKDEEPKPEPGSLSFCLYCGTLSIFDSAMILRAPTVAMLDELRDDPDFLREFANFQWARQRLLLEHKLLGSEEERAGKGEYELWAWVTIEADGGQGVITAEIPGSGLGQVPLHHKRKELALALEPIARQHEKTHGRPVRLAHLVEVVE